MVVEAKWYPPTGLAVRRKLSRTGFRAIAAERLRRRHILARLCSELGDEPYKISNALANDRPRLLIELVLRRAISDPRYHFMVSRATVHRGLRSEVLSRLMGLSVGCSRCAAEVELENDESGENVEYIETGDEDETANGAVEKTNGVISEDELETAADWLLKLILLRRFLSV